MKVLMISLDKNILDPNSEVSKRLLKRYAEDFLFILLPGSVDKVINLSEKIKVYAVGGGKIKQFFFLLKLGNKLCQEGIGEITTQDPFFTALIGRQLARKYAVRLEIQVHGDFYSTDYYKKQSCVSLIRYYLGKFLLSRADVVRVAGKRIQASLEKMGMDKKKIIVKPVEIDLEYIKNTKPSFSIKEKYPGFKKYFIFLGRFDRVKNLPWLIEVFSLVVKKNKYICLLLVGDGLEKDNILSSIKRNKLENNIKIEGWAKDIVSYLKTADCLLLPSKSEGYGLVVLEAVAVGLPVIMSDVGVANFELEKESKVKILSSFKREDWVNEMLSI